MEKAQYVFELFVKNNLVIFLILRSEILLLMTIDAVNEGKVIAKFRPNY